MFQTPDTHLDDTRLFVYQVGDKFHAIGLRGTENNRYERSGGTALGWLYARGDTVNLLDRSENLR